jgi:hypothetical protein
MIGLGRKNIRDGSGRRRIGQRAVTPERLRIGVPERTPFGAIVIGSQPGGLSGLGRRLGPIIVEIDLLGVIVTRTTGAATFAAEIGSLIGLSLFARLDLIGFFDLAGLYRAWFGEPVLLAIILLQQALLRLGIQIGNARGRSGQRHIDGSAQRIAGAKHVELTVAQELVHGAHALRLGLESVSGTLFRPQGSGGLCFVARHGRQQGQPCNAEHGPYSVAVHAQ